MTASELLVILKNAQNTKRNLKKRKGDQIWVSKTGMIKYCSETEVMAKLLLKIYQLIDD